MILALALLLALSPDESRALRAAAAASAVHAAMNAPRAAAIVGAVAHPKQIEYVSEYDAWQSPGWVWLHIGKIPCPHCDDAHDMQRMPEMVAASERFACVELTWPTDRARIRQWGVTWFPTDILIAPDRKTWFRFSGCPDNVAAYVARLNETGKAGAGD